MNGKFITALYDIGNIAGFVAENCGNADTAKYMNDIISIVELTLPKPIRNCDYGTEEEQRKRFANYCHSAGNPCLSGNCYYCKEKWLHLPFDKGATDEQ
jgi:hypothetical protein